MLILISTLAFGAEEEIPVSEVPEKVLATVGSRWAGYTIGRVEKEGRCYELELKDSSGNHLEVEISSRGRVLEVEPYEEEDEEDKKDERSDKDDKD
jgi:hypothetical protein